MILPKINNRKIVPPTASTFLWKNSRQLIKNYNGGMDYYSLKQKELKPRVDSNLKGSKNHKKFYIKNRNFVWENTKRLNPIQKTIKNDKKVNQTQKNNKFKIKNKTIKKNENKEEMIDYNMKDDISKNYTYEKDNMISRENLISKENLVTSSKNYKDDNLSLNMIIIKNLLKLNNYDLLDFFLKIKIYEKSKYNETYDLLYTKIEENEINILKNILIKLLNILNFEFQKITHKKEFTNYKKKIYEEFLVHIKYIENLKNKLIGDALYLENFNIE